jgi:hypothetical protein
VHLNSKTSKFFSHSREAVTFQHPLFERQFPISELPELEHTVGKIEMNGPSFAVHSGIGKFQLGAAKSRLHVPRCEESVESQQIPPQELIKKQNEQLHHLKEQFLRLRSQYEQERNDCTPKLLDLQRQLRIEQKIVEDLEQKIAEVSQQYHQEVARGRNGCSAVVEQIWQLMQRYRENLYSRDIKVKEEISPVGTSMHRP